MKKSTVIILLVIVALASSGITLGAQKLVATWSMGKGIVIITDARCEECDTSRLEAAFKTAFPTATLDVLDFGERKGKKLFEQEGVKLLPIVLVPKSYDQQETFKRFERFAKLGKNYYSLMIGGSFDPSAEICDNKKDDDKNKLVDCDDPACKKDWRCMEKREKPDVDVFVMSHCPFGTQIEKGLLPVWDLFGDKINLNIRFVDYAMHGKKEIDEQLKQYCVEDQGKQKLRNYLECFLKTGDTSDKCANQAGVDASALNACLKKADAEFGVTKAFEDKSQWKGQFPPFPIHAALAKKYGVSGSPTLVINDAVVNSGRSSKALRDAVCKAFKVEPPECQKEMDDANPSPGFGFGKDSGGGKAAKCGG
ncbi:MAG: hypothetical protein ABH871_07620 [Pseudomonadota bacterium]